MWFQILRMCVINVSVRTGLSVEGSDLPQLLSTLSFEMESLTELGTLVSEAQGPASVYLTVYRRFAAVPAFYMAAWGSEFRS